MQRDSGGGGCCGDDLAASLSALKQDGCAFLVAGETSPEIHARAGEQFLGEGDCRRMVLLSEDAYRPGPTAGSGPTVVRYRTDVRSAATAAAPGGGTDAVATDLEELGVAVLEEIETYEATAPDPSPGGFRLLFLSAAPLLADYDDEQVFSWLHLLVGRVRQATGMAFVHLPLDPGETPVPTLSPLFDGVVELRPDHGGQQRWVLEDHTSDWMDV